MFKGGLSTYSLYEITFQSAFFKFVVNIYNKIHKREDSFWNTSWENLLLVWYFSC